MSRRTHPPTRTLRDRPDLSQLKRQAKELLKAFAAGDADAVAEVNSHYPGASADTFALHDAQLVLARSHGFESWPKLKAYVDGVTVRRLIEAAAAGDLTAVQSMLSARPELVHLDTSEHDEHRALHHAVMQRHPEIVRVLMRYGADARKGIWPHRDATSPLTMSTERGDAEMVDIMREEERRRSETSIAPQDAPATAEPTGAFRRGDDATLMAVRSAVATGDAESLKARHAEGVISDGAELLTLAVESDRPEILRLLLEFGLDPDERVRLGGLEEVIWSWGGPLRACARAGDVLMAGILLDHGATPNTNVYAATTAMHEALRRHDERMVQLLEQHGGVVDAITAACLGLTDRVRQMFEDDSSGRLPDGVVTWPESLAYGVLESATDGGHVDLVRLALDRVDWRPGDAR